MPPGKDKGVDDSYAKPSYDGRLQYYQHLKIYLDQIASTSYKRDLNGWFHALQGYYSITQPFIKPSHADELDKELQDFEDSGALGALNIIKNKSDLIIIRHTAETTLRKINRKSFKYSKHLLCPVESSENTDYDEESFMRGSDL